MHILLPNSTFGGKLKEECMKYMEQNEQIPLDYDRLMTRLKELSDAYRFLDLHYIGTSILGKAIPAVTFGVGQRAVFYVGAHHGMEWMTSVLLLRYVEDFCRYYESGALYGKYRVRSIYDTHTITVIPMLNPDGVDYQIHGVEENNPFMERLKKINPEMVFSYWQANARGVDLNHNYDAGFWEYKRLETENGIEAGATRYSGTAPESEPEVAALCNLVRFQTNLRGILTLHTQGKEICYPSDKTIPNATHAIARHLSQLSNYRIAFPIGSAAYGGLSDWANLSCKIPCFTLECGAGKNPLPISDAPLIYADLKTALLAFPTLL